jgi:hypothetical protein
MSEKRKTVKKRLKHPPTNGEILVAFDAHAKEDQAFQGEQRGFNGEMSIFRAETEGSLAELHRKMPTKGDIEELKDFMKTVNVGIGIFKFSWNNAAKLGSFVLFIGGIFLFFKAGLAAAVAWLIRL